MGSKILIAADSFKAGNGGIARVARLMAKVIETLVGNGVIKARLLAFSDSARPEGINLPFGSARGSKVEFILKLMKMAKKYDWIFYDSVHMAKAHALIGKKTAKSLVWMHGIEVWNESRIINLVTLKRSDYVLSNSVFTLEAAREYHPFLKSINANVCWLGTEEDMKYLQRPRKEPRVLTVGRIIRNSKKGHHAILKAWPRVIKKIPNAKWIVVGQGDGLAMFRDQVLKAGLSGSVRVCGFVDEKLMPEYWDNACVFALPSKVEGFGIVYVEAMRHGLPVIASCHDAGAEINLDDITGYNLDPGNTADLAEKIVTLLQNKQLASHMGKMGRKRWEANFSYRSFCERFTRHCFKLLSW